MSRGVVVCEGRWWVGVWGKGGYREHKASLSCVTDRWWACSKDCARIGYLQAHS